MALSGPRTHHHDDDTGEGGPAVFADINITPLTDIFLVLLIIFMVTSTALVEAGQGGAGAGVRVDLPKGAAKELHIAAQDFPDRKSTRLNSSHLVISYAAFCLKKKKI